MPILRLGLHVLGGFLSGLVRSGVIWLMMLSVVVVLYTSWWELLSVVYLLLVGLLTFLGMLVSGIFAALGYAWDFMSPPRQKAQPQCESGYKLDLITKSCTPSAKPPPPPPPPPFIPTVERLQGLRAANFSGSCTWESASTEVVNCLQPETPNVKFEMVLTSLVAELGQPPALVIVGTASQEGQKVAQESLAERRAKQLASWIRQKTDFRGKIGIMNLGQFVGQKCRAKCGENETAWQRPIVLFAIEDAMPDAMLKERVLGALSKSEGKFPVPTQYSIGAPRVVWLAP